MSNKIIVTRHRHLVDFLIRHKIVEEGTPVISHATVDDIQGKHVVGVIPLWLAAYADRLTVVKIRVSNDKRGQELSAEDIEFFATLPARTYEIREIKNGWS